MFPLTAALLRPVPVAPPKFPGAPTLAPIPTMPAPLTEGPPPGPPPETPPAFPVTPPNLKQ